MPTHKYTYIWCNVNKCTNKFATVGDEHGKKALWETDVTDEETDEGKFRLQLYTSG